jgi:hypothetical protein
MVNTGISDVIQTDKMKVVRYILYMKLAEKGVTLSENELSLFCLFADSEDKDEVIDKALEMGYVKSVQTGENVISKLVIMDLLHKKDKKKRNFPEDIFPNDTMPLIAAKIIIHNIGYATTEV